MESQRLMPAIHVGCTPLKPSCAIGPGQKGHPSSLSLAKADQCAQHQPPPPHQDETAERKHRSVIVFFFLKKNHRISMPPRRDIVANN